MTSTWRFRALDTLFFRDARPHGSVGAAILGSLFPPSPRTVAGAVRFLLGNALGVDWAAFGRATPEDGYRVGGRDLLRLIGRHDDYGALGFSGPWLAVRTAGGWRRLYPAPRTLTAESRHRPAGRLTLGPAVTCDLGRVHLPVAPGRQRPVDELWLDADAYAEALAGRVPDSGHYSAADLFACEPRLGIGRDLDRHSAEPGLLYQTVHVRPHDVARGARPATPAREEVLEVAVETGVTCDEALPEGLAHLVRLGGEGRLADVRVTAGDPGLPPAPAPAGEALGLVLTLLTPADLGGSWLPSGFEATSPDGGPTTWRGELAGVPLELHSAVIGPAVREGGWDLAARKPRPVRSLVPAGSAWYATVHTREGRRLTGEALGPTIGALHGARLAGDALGYGQLAVGLFDATHFPYLEVPR